MDGMVVAVALNILFMNLLITFLGRDIDNVKEFKKVLITTSLLNVIVALGDLLNKICLLIGYLLNFKIRED